MRRCLKRRNRHGGAGVASVEIVPLPLARVSQQSLAPETQKEEPMTIDERVRELGLVLPEPFRSPTGVAYPFSWVRVRGTEVRSYPEHFPGARSRLIIADDTIACLTIAIRDCVIPYKFSTSG
jgi:hypothetical protein